MPSTITSLQILAAAGLTGVDGADAADVNGWVARITLADDDGTGALNQAFDPSKIVLTVSDPGFSSPAAAPNATIIRTIRGGAVLRTQTPNGTASNVAFAGNILLNSASGGVRTIYLSLTDFVFGGTTIVAAEAEAGYYGAASAGSIAGISSSSTKAYYRPLASWASLQHERRTGAFQPELVVTHLYGLNGRMGAGVRFRATDEGSGDTGDIDVTATVLSAEQTQGPVFEVFRPTVQLTNLTQGHRCILNAKVYPWLGDATAVLDLAAHGVATTGDWANANPRTPLRFFCDKTGGYGGAVAVVESGAIGGAIKATIEDARTSPFPTPEAAHAALSAWNNTFKAHNDVGGADIFMRNVSGSAVTIALGASLTATAGKTWCNFRPDPQNTAAISIGLAAARNVPAFTRFMVPVVQSGTGSFDNTSSFLWRPVCLEATTLICGGTSPIHFRNPSMLYRNLTISGLASGMSSPMAAAGAGRGQQVAQAMGVICEDATTDFTVDGMFSLLGCRFKRFRFANSANASLDSFDGSQFVSTWFRDIRSASVSSIGSISLTVGFHAVNLLVEGTMTSGGGVWKMGGDGDVGALDNVMVAYSTIPGTDTATASVQRFNHGYTDVAGAVGIVKNIFKRFSIFHQANIKTDTFTQNTGASGRTKNWPTRYGVGSRGNVMVRPDANGTGVSVNGANWSGEVLPPGSVINAGAVNFTDNKAGNGAAGSGTYSLTGSSNLAYDRVPGPATSGVQVNGVPASLAMSSYDVAGVARRLDGSGAAGLYETTFNPPITGAGSPTLTVPTASGDGDVFVRGGGAGSVAGPSASGQGGLTPVTGGGAGILPLPGASGAGEVVQPPITATGPILAAPERIIKVTVAPLPTSQGSGLPIAVWPWEAPFDPADRVPYAIDFSDLLTEGEKIAQIDRLAMSAPGAAVGLEIDSDAGRTPVIATGNGDMVQFWLRCSPTSQGLAAFLDGGVRVGVTALVRTDAAPFKQFERTGSVTVRQQ